MCLLDSLRMFICFIARSRWLISVVAGRACTYGTVQCSISSGVSWWVGNANECGFWGSPRTPYSGKVHSLGKFYFFEDGIDRKASRNNKQHINMLQTEDKLFTEMHIRHVAHFLWASHGIVSIDGVLLGRTMYYRAFRRGEKRHDRQWVPRSLFEAPVRWLERAAVCAHQPL